MSYKSKRPRRMYGLVRLRGRRHSFRFIRSRVLCIPSVDFGMQRVCPHGSFFKNCRGTGIGYLQGVTGRVVLPTTKPLRNVVTLIE